MRNESCNPSNGGVPQKMNLRAYIDKLRTEGYTVRDDHGDDPMLIAPNGDAVETWREDYPYPQLMSRNSYEVEKYLLQIELLKFQYWSMDTGAKHVIVFEGRDAAGKGGTIKRFIEHLNPRACTVVALTKPTTTESGQWYFQRYVNHLPTAGEIVLFDRSWYNRAGVERVMGFCTDDEYEVFMRQAPMFERMLADSGTTVTKLWFSVTQDEQRTRFAIRQIDPVRRWKLSPMDWRAWTGGRTTRPPSRRSSCTPTRSARRVITVKSNDKKRGRINALRAFLHQFDYTDKDPEIVFAPDPKIVARAKDTIGD